MKMKKILALFLSAVIAVALFSACQLSDNDTSAPETTAAPDGAAAPDATDGQGSSYLDLTAAVAKINGETVLTLGDVKTLFDMYVEYFQAYGYDVTGDTATLEGFQDDLVDMLVRDKLVEVKARELGYSNYTDEQKAELDARINDKLTELDSYYREQAESEAASDPSINVDERVMELILEEAIANLGDDNATYEDYCKALSEDIETQYLSELMKDDLTKDVKATDDEIEEAYNTSSAADMETYKANPEYYKDDEEGYELSSEGVPPLFVPQDYHRVLDIYVSFGTDIPTECTEAKTKMNNLKTEYCTLAFEDAINGTSTNAARIAEILDEYKKQQAEYDKYYGDYTKAAYEKINAAYARLEAGEDFAKVMADTTENTDFTEVDAFVGKGMLISNSYSSSSDWSSAAKEQFAKLSIGKYSPVFEDANGLRIIYYLGDEKAGSKDLGEVRDAIAASIAEEAKDTTWNTTIEEWLNEGSVELFTDVYRPLGK